MSRHRDYTPGHRDFKELTHADPADLEKLIPSATDCTVYPADTRYFLHPEHPNVTWSFPSSYVMPRHL